MFRILCACVCVIEYVFVCVGLCILGFDVAKYVFNDNIDCSFAEIDVKEKGCACAF